MRRSIFSILAVASAALAALTAGASAQAPGWSGAYLGAFAGSASGQSNIATVVDCNGVYYLCRVDLNQYLNNGALIGATATGAAAGSAFTAGGFAGHNWQNGQVVYGFEADAGAMPLHLAVSGSGTTLNLGLYNASSPGVYDIPSTFMVSASASTDWIATARARFGVLATPSLLLYATGGLAATELTVANAYSDNFNNGSGTGFTESSSTTELRTALVLGAGAEWAMAGRWRLRAEYLHADFGAVTTTGITQYLPDVTATNPITSTADLRVDIVRVGVAYGF